MESNSSIAPAYDTRTPDVLGLQEGDCIIHSQDEAEALLQPALSATARHLASQNTPAAEKAAALDKSIDDYLDIPADGAGDSSPDLLSSPEATSPVHGAPHPIQPRVKSPEDELSRDALPSPWQVQPMLPAFQGSRSPASGGILGSVLGTSRHRSRSAGQEAWRRISKALPSLGSPAHLLPSRPGSFFSSLSERSTTNNTGYFSQPSSTSQNQTSRTPSTSAPANLNLPIPIRSRPSPAQPAVIRTNSSAVSASRPKMLRRVTSDDALLYHNLSRASSLGDDETFQDVREMVNIRFMALKDSLPDVPNFKMPSLPKLYNQSKKSTHSLNNLQSSEALGSQSRYSKESDASSKHPSTALDRVLEHLTGDIVIMGGYRGSILRSAEPPHHQLWAPVKLGLNMRKANLEVGLEDEDEERMEETILPDGMCKHIGPVDISRKFLKKLRSCENARSGKLRVWDYGYDWRLSPPLLSRKLQEHLQTLPSNQPSVPAASRGALVISHSLGGIITRHAVNQRPDLFSGVLYCGTPQRCINILNPLRHGDVVLLNEKLLTAKVNFSMRTTFVFLPEDGFCFVDKNTGESYPIDFYDPQEWARWNLSPCVAPSLPAYNRQESSSLSSLLSNSLRSRANSVKNDKQPPPTTTTTRDRNPIAPQLGGHPAQNDEALPSDPERQRYLEYLARTLTRTRKFRSELAHSPSHQEMNAYPPLAVLYGKSIPTVYAAQVTCRDAIRHADAYDDLLFRPGDGVVLAKEAMLPEGYAVVRGGRVCTGRGHITMLGDLPAMGLALEALLRGRRKGIGLGVGGDDVQR